MKRQLLVRLGFILFLFFMGYLVGSGIAKTIRQFTVHHVITTSVVAEPLV